MLLSEEQRMIRDAARAFSRERLAPHSAEWDRSAMFPRDALRAMGQLGFLGMTVPPEWGGAGADYVAHARAPEGIAAGQPCLMQASMAKLFAAEMAEGVCSDSIQTFGGYGYLEDYGVERIYRAVRVSKIYEGTNDIQHLVIARAIAG